MSDAEQAWKADRESLLAEIDLYEKREAVQVGVIVTQAHRIAELEAGLAASPSEEVVALMKAIKERDEAREAYEMLVEMHYQRVGELVNERDAARAALRTTKTQPQGGQTT